MGRSVSYDIGEVRAIDVPNVEYSVVAAALVMIVVSLDFMMEAVPNISHNMDGGPNSLRILLKNEECPMSLEQTAVIHDHVYCTAIVLLHILSL